MVIMQRKINLIGQKIWEFLPLTLLSYIGANFFTIGLIAVMAPTAAQITIIKVVQVVFFGVLFYYLSKKNWWKIKNFSFQRLNWWLLILGGGLMITRGLIYFNALDDFTYHLPAGYYAYFQWQTEGTTAIGWSGLLPLLQIGYYPLIEIIGIRLTLLLFTGIGLIWWSSLNCRLADLWQLKKEKRFYLNLIFIIIYFLPELASSQMLLMSDFVTVLLAVEGMCIFWRQKGDYGLGLACGVLAFFAKQSTGAFIVPIFLYYGIKNWQKFKQNDWLIIASLGIVIIVYSLRSWLTIGTPTPLLNNFWQSLPSSAGSRDARWGPTNWREIVSWQMIGYYHPRFIEFLVELMKNFEKVFFTIWMSGLYLGSLVIGLKKKRGAELVIFASFILWALVSGFGRYRVALVAVAALLLFRDIQVWLPKIKHWPLRVGLILIIGLFVFRSARFDYAFRYDFFLQNLGNEHILDLTLLGHDRYQDLETQINLPTTKAKAIILQEEKSAADFYAFLLEKKYQLPIYKGLTIRSERTTTLNNPQLAQKVKSAIYAYEQLQNFVLVVDNLNHNQETDVFIQENNCQQLAKPADLRQFNYHTSYFGTVEVWECKRG